MLKLMYAFLTLALLLVIVSLFISSAHYSNKQIGVIEDPVEVMCTADAMQCPDGSFVGRTGADCAFVCPKSSENNETTPTEMIVLSSPELGAVITSPLSISGESKGGWFFEGSFPVVLTDWDGKIIAEGYVTATEDWMTVEPVAFTGNLIFESPYQVGDADFMKRGSLIFKKDNPSGLPENDGAYEVPVQFAP